MAFTPRTETYINVSSLSTPFNASVTLPGSTANGDIMFQLWGWSTAVTIDSVPTGWFLVAQNIANTDRYALYFKIASSEAGPYVWSWTATAKVRGVCSVYTAGDFSVQTGVLTDLTISNTEYRTSDGNVRAAGMTVPFPNSPLLFFGMVYSVNASRSFAKPTTPTTGWVEDDDSWSTTSDFAWTVDSYIWTGSGATGAMNAVLDASATATTKHAFAVALRPKAFSVTAATTAYSAAQTTAVALKATRTLAAGTAAYSMAGTAVVLTKSAAAYVLAAGTAAYSMVGTAVALKANRLLAAGTAAYSMVGTAVVLKANRLLAAGTAAYSMVGTAVALKANRLLAAGTAAYSMVGTAVVLSKGYKLVAGTAAYVMTGADVALRATRTLAAAAGSFAVAGTAVVLTRLAKLLAGVGSYIMQGRAVTLTYSGGAPPSVSGGEYQQMFRRRRR